MQQEKEMLNASLGSRSDWNRYPFELSISLWNAIENNHVECVRLLIEVGADVNARLFGQDLLCLASLEDHYQCLNLLLEAGADVNCRCEPWFRSSPLHCAAENGHIKCVMLLIKAGADVNQIDDSKNNDETPLVAAVQNGRIQCVSTLIKSGADVNIDRRVLGYARSVEMVRFLLKSGVKINTHWYVYYQCGSRKPAKEVLLADEVKSWLHMYYSVIPEKPVLDLLYAAGETQCLDYSQTKVDDLMGTCREAIRKHLLKLDRYTHLFGRVLKIGLPVTLASYLVFNQTLDDDIDYDFTVDEDEK